MPMQPAKYLCTYEREPSEYHHYALNFDMYTHFTSPIRRYADVIVHRLLSWSLGSQKEVLPVTSDECQDIADNCNSRKSIKLGLCHVCLFQFSEPFVAANHADHICQDA